MFICFSPYIVKVYAKKDTIGIHGATGKATSIILTRKEGNAMIDL
jgi:hypothetical protein